MKAGTGLQLAEDLNFQRRSWRAERLGWAMMALFVAAALAGLLGPGPLNRRSATASDGSMSVDYNRLERHGSHVLVRVRFSPTAAADGLIRMRVDHGYAEKMRLQRVDPEPQSVETDEEGMTFVFKPRDPGAQSRAVFYAESDSYGPIEARFSVEGKTALPIKQFLYP